MTFSLVLLGLLTMYGCQSAEAPSQTATPDTRPSSTSAQTPQTISTFTVEIMKGPTKPVEIWLEGPTNEKRIVEPKEISQTFDLAEGVYDLTVRCEGYRNFALRVQIPEMDGVKAAMERLPNDDGRDAPVEDPFKR